MTRHFDTDELERYDADPTAFRERRALESHVEECSACAADLEVVKEVTAALRSVETWHFADEVANATVQEALNALSERIAAEVEDANRLLRSFISSPLRFVWSGIGRLARYRTAGVVRVLCEASKAVRDKDPLHARNLAESAASIAEQLDDDYYPAAGVNHLRGLAWKEYANALRILGEFPKALDAVERGERAYRRILVHDRELASMQYVRATILWKQERPEALDAAKEAARRFENLRESRRWIEARMLEGVILVDIAHDPSSAASIFASLKEAIDPTEEPTLFAWLSHDLGVALADLGEGGEATRQLLAALQIYEAQGLATEVIRVRWSLARLALNTGNAEEAIRRLPTVRADCLATGMVTDAALVSLDLVQAHLFLGEWRAARSLAHEAFDVLRAAGVAPAVLSAMDYVRKATNAGSLQQSGLDHVRAFLRRLENQPALLFTLPVS